MLISAVRRIVDEVIKAEGADRGVDPSLIENLNYVVERPRERAHGDFSTNAPFLLARIFRSSPAQIADALIDRLKQRGEFASVEKGGAGFINFRLGPELWLGELREILARGSDYGRGAEKSEYVQLEFVSANPVGPMHVGHGRWAAVGDTLARIMEKAGYRVEREFYINDAGTQMDIFARSVAARYAELLGKEVEFPGDGYRGAYIYDIAREIIDSEGDKYLNLDEEERARAFKSIAYQMVLKHLKKVLESMDVRFDVWFSEQSLHDSGALDRAVEMLREKGCVYEKDGAVWFKSSDFGDEKDRVLIRSNGEPTYFLADIAYHMNKKERGFDRVIDIWGADHHGYVPRMKAAMRALSYGDDFLEVLIGQMVNLISEGKPVRMSKRTGEMVTLEELLDEVGKDALRFFFCSKSIDSTLDLDIDLAREQSQKNPVYYIQYSHARIASILRNAADRGYVIEETDTSRLNLLQREEEFELIYYLSMYPEVIEVCTRTRDVHHLPAYLLELASQFHSFYTKVRVIQDDRALAEARLMLVKAVKSVVADGLHLLGVDAPERM